MNKLERVWNVIAKDAQVITKKSNDTKNYIATGSGAAGQADSSSSRLTNSQTIALYDNVSSIGCAVDMISDKAGSVPISIFDEKEEEFDDEELPELLELLKNPSEMESEDSFIGDLASWFLITGNCYIIATGNIDKEPIELFAVSPINVQVEATNGEIQRIQVTNFLQPSINFVREETESGVRFVEVGPQKTLEIWIIKDFNSRKGGSDVLGVSKINSIYFKALQAFSGDNFNLSTVNNGASSSGILNIEEDISEKDFQDLKNEWEKKYEGTNNAGKVVVVKGSEVKFTQTTQTNADMQFLQLLTFSDKSIFTRFKVPLALVMGEQMTYNNLETSNIMLFDNAVKPVIDRIYNGLTTFLMRRYEDSENLILSYKPSDVPELQIRQSQMVESKKQLGVYSTNEIRKQDGASDPISNGDDVFGASNMIIIGTTQDAETTTQEDANDIQD